MTHKYLPLVLLLFVCLSINAQDKKWYLGINYSPALSYRVLFSEAHSYTDDIESPLFTNSFEVFGGLRFNERIMLLSGVGYQSYGVKSNLDEISSGDMIDSRYGYIYHSLNDTLTNAIIKSTYNYLSIPLLVNYSFLQKTKADFSVEAGVVLNLLLNTKSKSTYTLNGNEETENKTYSNLNVGPKLSSHIGVFYKYPVSEKFNLKVGPSFTMFLKSSNQLINETGYNPYRLAMNLGIEF